MLADARLVTTFQDEAEVAHEALIREWPALRDWLEDDREACASSAGWAKRQREWQREGEDSEALYRGARLAQALERAAVHQDMLSPVERRFLDVSHAVAERAQRERESELAQCALQKNDNRGLN